MCDVSPTESSAPLRRRWGASVGPEEAFAYEGSFDGLAPRSRGGEEDGSFWGASTWFAGGTACVTACATMQEAPGGATSQNRMARGASGSQPFAPTSATRQLAESALAQEGGPAFRVVAGGEGRKHDLWTCAGRARTCAPRAEGLTYRWEEGCWRDNTHAMLVSACAAPTPVEEHAVVYTQSEEPCSEEKYAVRAARLRRLPTCEAEVPSRPKAARSLATRPRARRVNSAPCGTSVAPGGSSEAAGASWTEFRLEEGRRVYLQASQVTPDLASAWVHGNAPWPRVCTLSLDSVERERTRTPADAPGPAADAQLMERVRADVAAWAAEVVEREQREIVAKLFAAAGADAQKAESHAEMPLADALRRERAWSAALEQALLRAGVAPPAREP